MLRIRCATKLAGRIIVLIAVIYALEWIRTIVNVWCGIKP